MKVDDTNNLPSLLHYSIARNFWGRKLSRIGEKYDSRRKYFCGVLAFSVPKDAMLPNLAEKTFMNTQKTVKFAKVLSLKSFPLYGMFTYRAIYKTPVDEAMHHLNTPSEWPHWHCSFHLPVKHPDQLLVSVDLWERERGREWGGKGGRKREEERGRKKEGRGKRGEGVFLKMRGMVFNVIYHHTSDQWYTRSH